jgi:hypothetical protein
VAGAQGLVVGTVAQAGDRFLVNARVVDTTTGRVALSRQVPLPAADLVALSSDAVVLRSTSGAVFRSVLLPGWGQFYNRETIKGVSFIGAEALAAGLAVAFHLIGADAEKRYDGLAHGTSSETFDLARADAENAYKLRNIFLIAAGGVHLVNILDAFISGKTYDPPGGGGGGASGLTYTW